MDSDNAQSPADYEPVSGQVLPPKEEEAIREIVRVEVSRSITYSGPLPQASEFQLYEQTLQGAADRILTMAEKEQEERITSQREYMRADIKWKLRGQITAGVLAFVFCALAGWLFAKEQYFTGAAILAMIAGLAYVFISGKHAKPEPRQTEKPEEE